MLIISIIIPIYKVEQYIGQCLNSVICQTYNKNDVEIECILVNDCTPDNSMKIAKEMIEKYNGDISFVCIQHNKNKGLSAARNSGIAIANGNYIFFLDSDDCIAPNSLQIFINYLKQYPYVDLFIGQIMKKPSNELLSPKINKPQIYNDKISIFRNFLSIDQHISAWNKLIKTDILKKNHLYFIEGLLFEDAPWLYNIFSHINSVIQIPDITYYYTTNPTGIMASLNTEEYTKEAIESSIIIIRNLLNNPPDYKIFHDKVTIEYLLYIHLIMTRGMYYFLSGKINKEQVLHFQKERKQLIYKALQSRRILLVIFCLLFIKPYYNLMKLGFFRRNYYYMHKTIEKLSHFTDFLHE